MPLWVYKGILSENSDVSMIFNHLDTGKDGAPLQIPARLFKNLLMKDSAVPLTVKQIACLLEVHPKTVQQWSRLGLIRRHSSSSRGSQRFLIADVVDALVNTPKLQRLPNGKGTSPTAKRSFNNLIFSC